MVIQRLASKPTFNIGYVGTVSDSAGGGGRFADPKQQAGPDSQFDRFNTPGAHGRTNLPRTSGGHRSNQQVSILQALHVSVPSQTVAWPA